jgi:hypothetical protein
VGENKRAASSKLIQPFWPGFSAFKEFERAITELAWSFFASGARLGGLVAPGRAAFFFLVVGLLVSACVWAGREIPNSVLTLSQKRIAI